MCAEFAHVFYLFRLLGFDCELFSWSQHQILECNDYVLHVRFTGNVFLLEVCFLLPTQVPGHEKHINTYSRPSHSRDRSFRIVGMKAISQLQIQ